VQIYLAMEEKEDKSAFKAQNLITTFTQSFYKMSYTVHPSNIPGEAQGKSSNESWAGKQACKDYSDPALKPNIIMTTMDGQLHPNMAVQEFCTDQP
jgi:mannose-6-phosphate isomerase class I